MKALKAKQTVLLIVLLMALGIYAFYSLLLAPKIADINELKGEIDQKDQEIRLKYEAINKYSEDAATLKITQEETREISDRFYVLDEQESYLDYIDNVTATNKILFEKIESEDYKKTETNLEGYRCEDPATAYVGEDFEMSGSDEEDTGLPEINDMKITAYGIGKYSAIKDMIAQIDQAEKRVICDGLRVERVNDGDDGSASLADEMQIEMSLRFVRLADLDSINSEEDFPELPTDFTMPPQFISGSYRDIIDFSSFKLFG